MMDYRCSLLDLPEDVVEALEMKLEKFNSVLDEEVRYLDMLYLKL